ncbi:MAG: thioredoxin domain-containing protein [Acidobacteria bacterium]|nr:thioredoxin domain-containing protein [Acidobacteriota bacterium]
MSRWFAGFATLGLIAASASTWVHHQLLTDPTYVSACDVNSTFSCSQAYTSAYGVVGGVSVALIGVLFFAFVLGLTLLASRSKTASENLPGYVFALSTLGLAGVLYLGYASFFILGTVCLLCVGTYVAVIGLFLTSGAAAKEPMSSLPGKAVSDLGALVRTPAALSLAGLFVAGAVAAVLSFPSNTVSAAPAADGEQTAAAPTPGAAQLAEFEKWLASQPRETVAVPADGAAVVIVKFNDYQCPPCRQTYMEYKPVLAKWARQAPGKVKFVTKDFALERECNATVSGDLHAAACDAAVAVRLAREKGKTETMEEWLFANQPTLTPASVRQAARDVAGVTDMEARYADTLAQVKADTNQGAQLKVTGTPTFFMNGMRLPGLRPEFFDAAIAWELKRTQGGGD